MRALRWCLFLAVILLFQMGSSVWAQTLDPTRQPSAQLRFVHALPGTPTVDIYRDGAKIVAGLPVGNATEYKMSIAGAQLISVRSGGADPATPPLFEQSITLNLGLSYTLAVAPDKNNSPSGLLLEDDTGVEGQARGSLRIVNLALGHPAIGAVADEAAVTGLLAYGESSLRVPIGKGAPVVTIIDDQGQQLLSLSPIPLENGEFYTLFVMGSGSNLSPIIVSYPLTSGEVPTFEHWLPIAPGGANADRTVAPAEAASSAAPAAVPVTGGSAQPSTQSLWFVLLGLLLMMSVVGFQWWRARQA